MNLDPEAMKAAMEQMKRLGPERMAEMQRQMQANPDLMRQAMAGPHPPPPPPPHAPLPCWPRGPRSLASQRPPPFPPPGGGGVRRGLRWGRGVRRAASPPGDLALPAPVLPR